jgi:hypothetical protein
VADQQLIRPRQAKVNFDYPPLEVEALISFTVISAFCDRLVSCLHYTFASYVVSNNLYHQFLSDDQDSYTFLTF